VHITEVGRTYVTHAERALEELTQGSDHLRAIHAVPRGRVRITSPVGISAMLAQSLAAFLVKAPLVSIDLDLTDRRVDLVAEDVDIALRSGPVDTPDFVARKLVDSRRHLFANAAYLDRQGRPKRLADLASHDLVATRSGASGAVWELFDANESDTVRKGKPSRGHRFTFRPRLTVNELMAAKQAAIAGAGISMLPAHECEGNIASGELERVLPGIEGARGGLWLLYRANRSLTAAVRACIEHLLDGLPQAKGRL
jgi:DNA-binding transcriptional LysR family regulator